MRKGVWVMIIVRPARATPPGLVGTRRRCRCRGSSPRPAPPGPGPPAAAAGRSRCPSAAGTVISSSTLGWKAYIPALIRSETGWLGFSANPMTRPAASSSTTPPADGFGEWNTVRVAIAPCPRCASMSDRRSKSVRLSALQARKNSSPSTHCRLATSVPALPSSSGSKTVRTAGGPACAARWRRTTSGRWCRLTRTSSTPARSNASSQMSSRGRSSMSSMHFGVVSVIGRRRLPTPAASRKAFTPPPCGRRRGRASARSPRPAPRRDRPCPRARRRTRRPIRPACASAPSPAPAGR